MDVLDTGGTAEYDFRLEASVRSAGGVRKLRDRHAPDAVDGRYIQLPFDHLRGPTVVAGQAVALVVDRQAIVGEQTKTRIARSNADQPGTQDANGGHEDPVERVSPRRAPQFVVGIEFEHAHFSADQQGTVVLCQDRAHRIGGPAIKLVDAAQFAVLVSEQPTGASDPGAAVGERHDCVDLQARQRLKFRGNAGGAVGVDQ